MSYQYLLDTNIVSDMIRYPAGAIAYKLSEVGEASVCTSIMAARLASFASSSR